MVSWYFIELYGKEKSKNILKEIESNRIARAIKKRDSRKYYNPLIKNCLLIFKAILSLKKEMNIKL